MGNLWLKIKIWTKGAIAAFVSVYALLFVYNNGADATVWWWFNRSFKSTTVVLIVIAFVVGVIGAILVRTMLRTLNQVRSMQTRSRTDRMERDLADMKEKASRLQTKPSASTQYDSTAPDQNDPIQ